MLLLIIAGRTLNAVAAEGNTLQQPVLGGVECVWVHLRIVTSRAFHSTHLSGRACQTYGKQPAAQQLNATHQRLRYHHSSLAWSGSDDAAKC